MNGIPKTVPAGTLAHKWCVMNGDRAAIHHSFKRWSFPGDYDRDELNRAIDKSLKEYPDALRVYPERTDAGGD